VGKERLLAPRKLGVLILIRKLQERWRGAERRGQV
jgi:hypothetical protein